MTLSFKDLIVTYCEKSAFLNLKGASGPQKCDLDSESIDGIKLGCRERESTTKMATARPHNNNHLLQLHFGDLHAHP